MTTPGRPDIQLRQGWSVEYKDDIAGPGNLMIVSFPNGYSAHIKLQRGGKWNRTDGVVDVSIWRGATICFGTPAMRGVSAAIPPEHVQAFCYSVAAMEKSKP